MKFANIPLEKRLLLSADRTNMFYWQSNRPFNELEIKKIFMQRDNLLSEADIVSAIRYFLKKKGLPGEKYISHEARIKWGSINLVFPFKTNKRELIIRIHPNNLLNGYFSAELGINKEILKRNIKTYEVLYVNDKMIDFNFCFFICTKFQGIVGSAAIESNDIKETELSYLLGQKVGEIHSIKTKGYGFFNNNLYKKKKILRGIHKNQKDFFFAGLKEEFNYLLSVKVLKGIDIQAIESFFLKNKPLIECECPVLIHNDVAPWNCILTEDNKDVVLTDWDESFSGDPVMDFAQFNLFYNDENFTQFINGYKKRSQLPSKFEDKLKVYRLRYLTTKLNLRRKKLEQEEMIREKYELGLKMLKEEMERF